MIKLKALAFENFNTYTKMFGRQSGLSSSGGSGSNLVEFRAGRMNLIDKMVHPDTRKGLVYLTQGDDGLMHFCWKDRTTGKVIGFHMFLKLEFFNEKLCGL